MLNKYQEYFKDGEYKFLLKYDGERKERKYTVRIYDKNDALNVYGKDTNNPIDDFNIFLDEVGISLSSVDNIMFSDFSTLLNLTLSLFGKNVIFSFLVENLKEVTINFNLIDNSQSFSYQSNNIDDIVEYINKML